MPDDSTPRSGTRPGRTISDALRDEEMSKIDREHESNRKRNIVPRDPSARPVGSEGGYQRMPVRYE